MHRPNVNLAYRRIPNNPRTSERRPPRGGVSRSGHIPADPGPDRGAPRECAAPGYFSAPAVRPATTCRWKTMYAASTGSIAITSPAKSPDQSPL